MSLQCALAAPGWPAIEMLSGLTSLAHEHNVSTDEYYAAPTTQINLINMSPICLSQEHFSWVNFLWLSKPVSHSQLHTVIPVTALRSSISEAAGGHPAGGHPAGCWLAGRKHRQFIFLTWIFHSLLDSSALFMPPSLKSRLPMWKCYCV